MSVPITEPAFIERQSTIHRSLSPPKILGQKAKASTKVILQEQALFNDLYFDLIW